MVKSIVAIADRWANPVRMSNLASFDPGMAAQLRDEIAEIKAIADPKLLDPPKKDDDQATGNTAETNGHRPLPLSEIHQHIGMGYSTIVPRPLLPKDPIQPEPEPEEPQEPQEVFHQYMSWGYEQPEAFDSNPSFAKSRRTVGEVLAAPTQAPQQLPFGLVDVNNQLQLSRRTLSPVDQTFTIMEDVTPSLSPPPPSFLFPQEHFPSSINLMNMHTEPIPLHTYSFHEPTFERRLARAALESGYQLLHNAKVQPSLLNYVFKLSLPWLSIEELKEKFSILLSRGVDEELDWNDAPFIHLGNAGLHYPRHDPYGNTIQRSHTYSARQIGPLHRKQLRLEGLTVEGIMSHKDMDLDSFSGDWFDAHDVEGYLRDKYQCEFESKDWARVWIANGDALLRGIQSRPSIVSSLRFSSSRGGSVASDRRSSNESLTVPSLSSSSERTSPLTSGMAMTTRMSNGYNNPNRQNGFSQGHLNLETPLPPVQRWNRIESWDRGKRPLDRHFGLDCSPGHDLGYAADPNYNGTRGVPWLGRSSESESVELPAMRLSNKTCLRLNVEALIKGKHMQRLLLRRRDRGERVCMADYW